MSVVKIRFQNVLSSYTLSSRTNWATSLRRGTTTFHSLFKIRLSWHSLFLSCFNILWIIRHKYNQPNHEHALPSPMSLASHLGTPSRHVISLHYLAMDARERYIFPLCLCVSVSLCLCSKTFRARILHADVQSLSLLCFLCICVRVLKPLTMEISTHHPANDPCQCLQPRGETGNLSPNMSQPLVLEMSRSFNF